MGAMMAVMACCVIGFAVNVVIAIVKIGVRPRNILLAGGYLLMGLLPALLVWGGFFLAGWIGDKTEYVGQAGLFVGAVFPGILALGIIPRFATVALKQTSGIDVN